MLVQDHRGTTTAGPIDQLRRLVSRSGAEYVGMNGREQELAVADGWLAGTLTRRQALGRLLALGVTGPSALAFLAACSSGSGGGAPGQTSTKPSVAIGIVQEPTSLDPTAQATASISLLLRDNVYEGLVRLNPDLQV